MRGLDRRPRAIHVLDRVLDRPGDNECDRDVLVAFVCREGAAAGLVATPVECAPYKRLALLWFL